MCICSKHFKSLDFHPLPPGIVFFGVRYYKSPYKQFDLIVVYRC